MCKGHEGGGCPGMIRKVKRWKKETKKERKKGSKKEREREYWAYGCMGSYYCDSP